MGYARHIWTKIPPYMGGQKLIFQMAAFTPRRRLKMTRGLKIRFGRGLPETILGQSVYNYAYLHSTGACSPDTGAPRCKSGYLTIFGRN
jgi:hypothetical protein